MTIPPVTGSLNRHEIELTGSKSPQSLVRKLETRLNQQETAFDRLKRVRNLPETQRNAAHPIDDWLANPQRFRSGGLRALIYLSQYLEEVAEACADLSGVAERFFRSVISSGEKSDIPYILASGVGRIVAAQLNLLGVAMHKAIGGGLYALSTLLSIGIVAIIKAGWARPRSEQEFRCALQRSKAGFSLGKRLATAMVSIKEKTLKKVIEKTENHRLRVVRNTGKLVRYLSAHHPSNQPHEVWKRRTNSNYIWSNMHQYGRLTQALMSVAHGLFQGVNRLAVSFDKHIGISLGSILLREKAGYILGSRIGLTASVGAAAAISVPLSPFLVGIWTVGAIACAASIALILLAKMNIHLNCDWKGNITPPMKVRFSAR